MAINMELIIEQAQAKVEALAILRKLGYSIEETRNGFVATKHKEERFLTISEVSDLLHVHANTIRRWSDSGALRCYRFGGKRRFTPSDIKEFLERST